MTDKTKHYRKLRATSHWLLQTLIECMLVWSLANTLVLVLNRYVEAIHFSKSREYVAYAVLILFYVLTRFPDLISRFEAIEKGEAEVKKDGGKLKSGMDKQVVKTAALPALVTNPDLTLLIREYKRKKIMTIALYSCSGLTLILGFTSVFFLLFVYDFSPLKSNPVPKLDQFLIPIMVACVVIFYTIKMISSRTSSLDKQFVSKVGELKDRDIALNSVEKPVSNLGFPVEVMDASNHLNISMAAFVRYCVKNGMYDPFTIEAWRPIDGVIFNAKGSPISAKQLAQSYQDQLMKGTIVPPPIH